MGSEKQRISTLKRLVVQNGEDFVICINSINISLGEILISIDGSEFNFNTGLSAVRIRHRILTQKNKPFKKRKEIFEDAICLIAEYTVNRVRLVHETYPNCSILEIEQHLNRWKEESLALKENLTTQFSNLGYVDRIGNYFDF